MSIYCILGDPDTKHSLCVLMIVGSESVKEPRKWKLVLPETMMWLLRAFLMRQLDYATARKRG
jgi:hypothetical protein